MRHLLRVAIGSCILCLITTHTKIKAGQHTTPKIADRLQKALNNRNLTSITSLLSKAEAKKAKVKYKAFLNLYPNARWVVKESDKSKINKKLLEITIEGERYENGQRYSLNGTQQVSFILKGGRIYDQEIVSQQSIVRSGKERLPIVIGIPNAVLTGTRYDVDIILDRPLGGAIVAAGLIPLTRRQINNQTSPSIELSPMGGGGLFKSVQAPLEPGVQNWAALLAHPKGIVSVSKMVKVVSSESELIKYK